MIKVLVLYCVHGDGVAMAGHYGRFFVPPTVTIPRIWVFHRVNFKYTQTELFGSRFNSTRLWCRIVPAQFKSFDFCHYFGPAWKQHMRLPNTLFKTDCEVTLKTSDIYFPLVLIHQWYTLIFDDLQYNPLNLRGACCSLAATSELSHETDVFEGCYSFWFTGIYVSKCSKSHLPSSWRDLDFFLKESKTHF